MLYSSTIQMSNWTNEFPEYFATNVQHLPHLSYRILQHPQLNWLNKMCNSIDPWQLNWKAMNAKYSNHGEPQNCLRFTSPARCKYNTKTLQKKYSERSFETKMINWSVEKLESWIVSLPAADNYSWSGRAFFPPQLSQTILLYRLTWGCLKVEIEEPGLALSNFDLWKPNKL